MNPFIAAILDVSRFAAALAQWHQIDKDKQGAIMAALSDNHWTLLVDCLRHSGSWVEETQRPSPATLERLTHE